MVESEKNNPRVYQCEVHIIFSGNQFEADNVEEYKKMVRENIWTEFNIEHLSDNEIKNITDVTDEYNDAFRDEPDAEETKAYFKHMKDDN